MVVKDRMDEEDVITEGKSLRTYPARLLQYLSGTKPLERGRSRK